MEPIVGLIYTGKYGRSPFDPTLWSSISSRLFGQLQKRGALERALGIDLPKWSKTIEMLTHFRLNRERWKSRFYASTSYRNALTRQAAREIGAIDPNAVYLQIGAMFNTPEILQGKCLCFSYHDGNLAERLNSPLPSPGFDAKFIERALAYERQVYHGMKRVFTFSEYLRNSFIKHYGVPEDRVISIGAGINLDTIPGPQPDKKYDTQEILFIGVDFKRKGGENLVRAFSQVREKLPKAVLHIVGPNVSAIANSLGQGIVCHGFLSKGTPENADKFQQLFRQSCLFVMPSLYEPFGIAPLEAMANQIPCLLSNQWALAEMVQPGVTGELVNPLNVDEMAEKMIQLLSNPNHLQQMGRAARTEVIEKYSWDKVADRLLAEILAAA